MGRTPDSESGAARHNSTMSHRAPHRRKPELSGHQKQIRFLTRLFVIICSLTTLAFFWFVNRPSSFTH
jgi:hypothetical protein